MFSILRKLSNARLALTLESNAPVKFSNHQLPTIVQANLQLVRNKSKNHNKTKQMLSDSESDIEDDNEWDNKIIDKNTKIMQINVNSLRVDGILKSGLGIARNKIDILFYESKIRLNGEKFMKKSQIIAEGDEIDVIKHENEKNPNLITVARIEILKLNEKEEGFNIKIRRCKSLVVEAYK